MSVAAIVVKYLTSPEVNGVNIVYSLIFIVLQFSILAIGLITLKKQWLNFM